MYEKGQGVEIYIYIYIFRRASFSQQCLYLVELVRENLFSEKKCLGLGGLGHVLEVIPLQMLLIQLPGRRERRFSAVLLKWAPNRVP